jgi:curved DNA-binding protein CbpA
VDISESGARIESSEPIEANAEVFLRVDEYGLVGCAAVRHCARRGAKYVIGLELTEDRGPEAHAGVEDDFVDFYELMQISPAAEAETIHRVYRMLAARYHPDNTETGDPERFLLLTRAYQTLSNPERRGAYDAAYQLRQARPIRIFELKEFIGSVDGEANRRLGILCLLYNRRRLSPENPGLSVLEFEQMMSFPREHLMFTFWFLKEKGHIRSEHNGNYSITVDGADYVEQHLPAHREMRKLLSSSEEWDFRDDGPGEASSANGDSESLRQRTFTSFGLPAC